MVFYSVLHFSVSVLTLDTFELVVEFWITDTLKKRTVLNNMFSSTTSAGALEAKELR